MLFPYGGNSDRVPLLPSVPEAEKAMAEMSGRPQGQLPASWRRGE